MNLHLCAMPENQTIRTVLRFFGDKKNKLILRSSKPEMRTVGTSCEAEFMCYKAYKRELSWQKLLFCSDEHTEFFGAGLAFSVKWPRNWALFDMWTPRIAMLAEAVKVFCVLKLRWHNKGWVFKGKRAKICLLWIGLSFLNPIPRF